MWRRSTVLTTRGLVCSSSPLAAAIGSRVLGDGGTAVDAAVAVAAAECVTMPAMCGIGGEAFALYYDAKSRTIEGIMGGGRSPMGATREAFVDRGFTKTMPTVGPLCASVPGEVAAWETMLQRWGSRPLGALLAPAIRLADEGFPLPRQTAAYFSSHRDKLRRYPSTARVFLKADGSPYVEGDVLVQSDLARTLRSVATGGADEFYGGAVAAAIAHSVGEAGGVLDAADLAQHRTASAADFAGVRPPSVRFRGYNVHATGLPTHGVLTLELLSLLDGHADALAAHGPNSADGVHLMVEMKRLAFADRVAYVADPRFVPSAPAAVDELLSPAYAARRRRSFDPERRAEAVVAGELHHRRGGGGGGGGDMGVPSPSTSYFAVADSAGNAVSFIHSVSCQLHVVSMQQRACIGCGFVAGDTGVLLNDRVARGFSLMEGHANVVAPGKRTMNTIHTWMATDDDGRLVLVGGTPGGDNQPQWNAQVLCNALVHGMDVQQAVDEPRWSHWPGTDPRTIDEPMVLRLESGFSAATIEGLRRRGHVLGTYPRDDSPGAAQLIAIDAVTGVRRGASDGRCEGYPVPE